jgi:[ribosomal protein S18]-alanine N-acetyltransferase
VRWPEHHLRRPMLLADVPQVLAVEVLAYGHPWSPGNFSDSIKANFLAEVVHNPQGELLAYFVAMAGVDELHLLNITVAPAHQGQGLGQRLLGVVQAHARALGLATLWLEVRTSNQRARALYQRWGFAEVGLRKGYYPAGTRREDAVVMKLLLDQELGVYSVADSISP